MFWLKIFLSRRVWSFSKWWTYHIKPIQKRTPTYFASPCCLSWPQCLARNNTIRVEACLRFLWYLYSVYFIWCPLLRLSLQKDAVIYKTMFIYHTSVMSENKYKPQQFLQNELSQRCSRWQHLASWLLFYNLVSSADKLKTCVIWSVTFAMCKHICFSFWYTSTIFHYYLSMNKTLLFCVVSANI